jgi:AcrR family transcriptional regulator
MSSPQVRLSSGDRRQQILEAATELFARQGFSGTTTRQIAHKAAVNEAIIFRHFGSKEELYWAVIEGQCATRGGRARLEELLASGLSDAQLLTTFVEYLLRREVTLTRLLLFTALENHELSDRFFRTHVARYYELLADYVRKGIAEGRFRQMDPLLAARALLGMVAHHYQVQEVFGGKRHHHFNPHEVSRTLVDLWLQGMRPLPAGAAREKAESREPVATG